MGLKTKDYFVDALGITLHEAYAQVKELHFRGDACSVLFHIQKDREAVANYAPVKKISLSFAADRSKNLFEQAYAKGKEKLFEGWEDDIVTESIDVTTDEDAPEIDGTAEEATEWF